MNIEHLKYFIVFIMLIFGIKASNAQELNCQVEVNSSKIEGTDKSVFTTLQEAITEYFNTHKWTNARFFLTVNERDGDKFKCDIQVQLSRPVYNSSYTTTLLNFRDTKVEFDYQENEPLIFSENSMESNLTAILNFYAYLFLALDFDSFSLNGGQAYYDKAASIVQMAQSSGEVGWKAFEDSKNRSAVLSAYTDGNTKGIRTLIYNYHRKGLDEMATSPDKGRAMITESLEEIKKIYDVAPMSVALSMFKDAKLDELVNIYSMAGSSEKDQVYEILKPVYPTENDRLNKIKDPETANK